MNDSTLDFILNFTKSKNTYIDFRNSNSCKKNLENSFYGASFLIMIKSLIFLSLSLTDLRKNLTNPELPSQALHWS